MEDQHLRAAEQRGVELERWVFGGRADQSDGAVLDKGQEAVLLRAVEAVDLVHEEQGLAADPGMFLGLGEDLFEVRHARKDRADRDEAQAHGVGEQAGDGGLAGAGRAPEDDRREAASGDHPPDRALGAGEVFLSHDLIERARAQAIGEGRAFGGLLGLGWGFVGCEQVGHRSPR